MSIDLNCDVGEMTGVDAEMIPLIRSANIACGFHAGNNDSMKETILLCRRHKTAIGAHPSWPDKENFGRAEMQLSEAALYEIIVRQLDCISAIAKEQGCQLHHVKPHGALYNQSAKDKTIAAVIAQAVYDFDSTLVLFGLSGSCSIAEAQQRGLATANEVFADRAYREDGSLTPRSQPHAMLDAAQAVSQVRQMILQQSVTSTTGKIIPIQADTICLHGDGPHALCVAKDIVSALNKAHVIIQKI